MDFICWFSKVTDDRVADLRNKNRELEKFKFVLELKIQEMKKQIEPKEANVVDLKQRIDVSNPSYPVTMPFSF